MAGPKHRAPLVNPRIYDEEVVVFREHVLIDKVHAPFLWIRADFVAAFDKTAVLDRNRTSNHQGIFFFKMEILRMVYRFFPLGSSCFPQRIMILTDMKPEKMLRGKVSSTFGTSIGVRFGIVNFELFKS